MKLFGGKKPEDRSSGEYNEYHRLNDEDINGEDFPESAFAIESWVREYDLTADVDGELDLKDVPAENEPVENEPVMKQSPEDAPDGGDPPKSKGPGKGVRRLLITLAVIAGLALVLFVGWKIFTVEPDTDDSGLVAVVPTPDASKAPEEEPDETEPPNSDSARRPGTYTFVAAATDKVSGDTDTIMVGLMDTVEKKLNIVSIPRDTMANITWGDSREIKKINQAYKRGGDTKEEKVQGLKDAIRDLIGFNVDNYVVIDLEGFEVLIDTIGGVDFDVPMDMYYSDPVQDFHVAINKGYQHLDGENALKVVRFRGEGSNGYYNGDIGRIETQQAFLKATAEQLLTIGNITKAKQFAQIFVDYVDTSWTVNNIAWLGEEFLKLDSEDINFYRLPAYDFAAVNEQSYVTIRLAEWLEMINTHLSPYKPEYQITEQYVNILTLDQSIPEEESHVYLEDGEDQFYVTNEGKIAGGFDSIMKHISKY